MSVSAASSVARTRVLAGFRKLNRARTQLFRGDDHAMTVSREQMRAEFIRNKNEPAQGPQWEAMVAGIDEATDMLVHEIIRGDLNDDSGRYQMKIKRDHVKGSDTGETKPEVELVTEDMVNRMENPGQVEVCKSSSSKKNE